MRRRLRSLSDSGSGLQSSFAGGAGQYRLAEHRYGREELLALYTVSSSVSPDLEDSSVMLPKPVPPLALVPMSEDEQVGVCCQSTKFKHVLHCALSFLWQLPSSSDHHCAVA